MKIQIWDTAGQERFDSLTKMYFHKAQAAFIVYDITDRKSLEKAKKWNDELDKHMDTNNAMITKFLVGNKSDLTEKQDVT